MRSIFIAAIALVAGLLLGFLIYARVLNAIVVVTKADRQDVDKVDDLYRKRVGVQIGTTHEEWAVENLEKSREGCSQ